MITSAPLTIYPDTIGTT